MLNEEQIIIEKIKTNFNAVIDSNKLDEVRSIIERELISVLKKIKLNLNENQRLFDNIESRIKSKDSFKQKIKRKDYVNEWNVKEIIDDSNEVQKYICRNLTDLIGFRINCFFINDEQNLYEQFKRMSENDVFSKKFSLNFKEKLKQDNGHKIYKFSGIYDDSYCFEVQIKSIMHSLWGEVEHKTIYKNQRYDAGIIPKKALIEGMFEILTASDKQLVTLFNQSVTEEKSVQALFFSQTEKLLNDKIEVMAKHYSLFFGIFSEESEIIKEYVGHTLLGNTFIKKNLPLMAKHSLTSKMSTAILEEYKKYDIECIKFITSILFNIEEYEEFFIYLVNYICNKLVDTPMFNDDEFDSIDDAFSDAGDEEVSIIQDTPEMICRDVVNKLKEMRG